MSDGRARSLPAAAKRALDILLALAAVLLTLPLQALLLLWIWYSSGRPLLHREMRLGRGGRAFEICKLRSLAPAAAPQRNIAIDGDPRITAPGRLLRRTRLDELPQLWLVLWGDMSLVGPRPLPPAHAAAADPTVVEVIQSVRPGCTGAAALEFIADDEVLAGWIEEHGGVEPEQVYLTHILPHKLAAECGYVENWSLWLDLKILARTLATLLLGSGRDASRRRVRDILEGQVKTR